MAEKKDVLKEIAEIVGGEGDVQQRFAAIQGKLKEEGVFVESAVRVAQAARAKARADAAKGRKALGSGRKRFDEKTDKQKEVLAERRERKTAKAEDAE